MIEERGHRDDCPALASERPLYLTGTVLFIGTESHLVARCSESEDCGASTLVPFSEIEQRVLNTGVAVGRRRRAPAPSPV